MAAGDDKKGSERNDVKKSGGPGIKKRNENDRERERDTERRRDINENGGPGIKQK